MKFLFVKKNIEGDEKQYKIMKKQIRRSYETDRQKFCIDGSTG